MTQGAHVLERFKGIRSVFRNALSSRSLRHLEGATALFIAAEFGSWLIFMVYAYDRGGSSAAADILLIQLVPCAVAAPFLGAYIDRLRPGRVLQVGFFFQAAAMGCAAVAIRSGASFWVVAAIACVVNLCFTVTRPATATLLPTLDTSLDELTAANAVTQWMTALGGMGGPVVVGVVLNASGPAWALAATGVMSLIAALLMIGTPGPVPGAAPVSVVDELRTNCAASIGDRSTTTLLTLNLYYFAVIGAMDLLVVLLAIEVLHMGQGGAGYLEGAAAFGAVLAGAITIFIVGRSKLAWIMVTGLLGVGLAVAVLGVHATVLLAFVLLGISGLAESVFEVSAQTLLQRSAPPDSLAGVFAILESIMNAGMALGVVMVKVALALGGVRAALIVPGLVGVLLVLALARQIRGVNEGAHHPVVQIRLLERLSVFAPLSPESLERLAHHMEPHSVDVGAEVVRQGDPGDRYFAVASGTMDVHHDGEHVATLGAGEGFGQNALLHDVPHSVTVTATSPVHLYALCKDEFISALTGKRALSGAGGSQAPNGAPMDPEAAP